MGYISYNTIKKTEHLEHNMINNIASHSTSLVNVAGFDEYPFCRPVHPSTHESFSASTLEPLPPPSKGRK